MRFLGRDVAASYLAAVGLVIQNGSGWAQAQPDKSAAAAPKPPIGEPGLMARYRCERAGDPPASLVEALSLGLGPVESSAGETRQWLMIEGTKASGERFRVWLLSSGYPVEKLAEAQQTTARYILQEGDREPVEFRDRVSGGPVLPSLGGWRHLFPRSATVSADAGLAQPFPPAVHYLGQNYRREVLQATNNVPMPTATRVMNLLPDVLIGLPSNTRQKDEKRRFDGSDYELVSLKAEDYQEMADAGVNCVRVNAQQLPWVQNLEVFYWGPGGNEVPYPECLYRSTYLGPALFLDEPAVGTRDSVIRPRLAKEEAFRQSITPQAVFDAFQEYFRKAWSEGVARALMSGLAGRSDVALGDMDFLQENLFSWDTVVSSAAYQLSQDSRVPAAMVFEPPGRLGSRRTIPEIDMTYGCQLTPEDPRNLADIIYGFLRGAARLTGKQWGMSIYGAVDPADAPRFLSHAYDLGATKFFFWDNAQLACVPFHESLTLARQLRAHAQNYPQRDLARLRQAAEIAILLPPGYNLGHVQLGKGSLWGVGELNLERLNRAGIKYRVVMGNFFSEIERCLRLGIAFDLLWELPDLNLSGYREIIRVREDGKVQLEQGGRQTLLERPRQPPRPDGAPPSLEVQLSANHGSAPLRISARATVTETSAPVFYTQGADRDGVYHNAAVAWELHGPTEADYRFLQADGLKPQVVRISGGFETFVNLGLNRPGTYRLRAATLDLAGRSTVRWLTVRVAE